MVNDVAKTSKIYAIANTNYPAPVYQIYRIVLLPNQQFTYKTRWYPAQDVRPASRGRLERLLKVPQGEQREDVYRVSRSFNARAMQETNAHFARRRFDLAYVPVESFEEN